MKFYINRANNTEKISVIEIKDLNHLISIMKQEDYPLIISDDGISTYNGREYPYITIYDDYVE